MVIMHALIYSECVLYRFSCVGVRTGGKKAEIIDRIQSHPGYQQSQSNNTMSVNSSPITTSIPMSKRRSNEVSEAFVIQRMPCLNESVAFGWPS